MGLLDILIIGLILISVLVGLIRGFTKELLSIATWLIATYLAFNFYGPLGSYYSQFINNELASNLAAGGTIFIGTVLVLSMISFLITRAVRSSAVKGVDRVLGSFLGVVRGVLIISFLIVMASTLNIQNRDIWKESQLVEYFEPVASTLNEVLPDKFKVTKIAGSAEAAASALEVIAPQFSSKIESERSEPEPKPSKN